MEHLARAISKDKETPMRYDASEHPVVVYNLNMIPLCEISDPDAIQDMYTTQQKHVSKHPYFADLFSPIFKDVFGLMPTSEKWRKERKAISHMFFRDRLSIIIDVFKRHVNHQCELWMTKLDSYLGDPVRVDISTEFSILFG